MDRVTATITGPGESAARVPGLLEQLARARAIDADAVADMQVALDEILSNILTHGFVGGQPHRIDLVISVDGQRLTAEVEDDCAAFDPLLVPPPEIGAPLKDRRVGGLGVHFVRKLMSEVSYSRVGERNRLVLVKLLAGGHRVDGDA